MTDEPTNLILEQLKLIRKEQADQRTLLLHHTDLLRRIERRVAEGERRVDELKDDLEMMLKSEIMGRLGNFENEIDRRMDEIEAKLRER
ncbi:hypothetical protein J2D73_18470 [Acetobacter sacchari]|uniref:Uncharacterized protein n=1 Tax=Acetobacter sacchari TaxID=2661687 RepID=A0ABS3M0P1_9PROT|nr:hypothetical protein [Acetobacter sacchari]MBO1361770.1 hypothetical protein [Acetobacter sacchari]